MTTNLRSPWMLFRFALATLLLCAGCGGDSSGPTSPDSDAPTVQFTWPQAGQVCAGIVSLTAQAENAERVKFYVGSDLIAADESSPYEATWNTATVANGSQTLKARAEGSGGTAEDVRVVTVNNQAGVTINVAPGTATVAAGQSLQFTALVSGTTNTGVTWSVDEGILHGAVDAAGLYTAPSTVPGPPTATVRATSVADPSRSASAIVTITGGAAEIGITISPTAVTLQAGQTQQFTAAVTGTTNTGVTWTVVEGAAHGAVTTTGLYTAPTTIPAPPSATVRVASVADPSKSADAQITLAGTSDEENELIHRLYNIGSDCFAITDDILETATWGVWAATRTVGGEGITNTGTITQTGSGEDDWNYSATPADGLVLLYLDGTRKEIRFTRCEISITDWPTDALNSHALTFAYQTQGVADLNVQSDSRYTALAPDVRHSASPMDYTTEFETSVTGTLMAEGDTHTLDITRNGQVEMQVDAWSDWLYTKSINTYSGTIGRASLQYTVNASDYFNYTYYSSTHVVNQQMTNNSSANANGVLYQFENAHVQWASGAHYGGGGYDETRINSVIDPEYWIAEGGVRKNGAVLGGLVFSVQPVDGQLFGPDLLLAMEGGQTAFLHTLIRN